MFATLFAVVVALVLGHVAQSLSATVRRFGWVSDWAGWLRANLGGDGIWSGRYGGLLLILPPVALVALLVLGLDRVAWGLPALLFGTAMLYYCWGPRDLDLDVDAVLDADSGADQRLAAMRLCDGGCSQTTMDAFALVGAAFNSARHRWFGVLFWFLLLGPAGALLYRLAVLCARDDPGLALPAGNRAGVRTLLCVLDWPVAQLMTGALALVGNFDAVFSAWKDNGGASFDTHADFLAAAGRASVRVELDEQAQDSSAATVDTPDDDARPRADATQALNDLPELRDAMNLIWRMLIVWLVILALFVVAGWLG